MASIKGTLITSDGRQDVTRRFLADKDIISCYLGMLAKINHVFPGLTQDQFSVYWKDCDGDLVVISNDDDAHLAVTSVQPGSSLHIIIKDLASPALLHPGVICDGCNGAIYGRRFKCAVCRDYDLCATCDKQEIHTKHPMIRIATPREQCFRNQGPPFCAMGGQSRSCPRFWAEKCGSSSRPNVFMGPFGAAPAAGLFGGPSFSSFSPASFQEYSQMARNIMKNWTEAMQPQPQPGEPESAKSTNASAPNEDKGNRFNEGFDSEAFAALMEEISENFQGVFGPLGGKRKADCDETQTGEGPKEKQRRQGEGEPQNCSPAFDFEKMADVIQPLVSSFFGAMGDIPKQDPTTKKDGTNSEKSKPCEQEQQANGQESRSQPTLEDFLKPWLNTWQSAMNSSNDTHMRDAQTNKSTQEGAEASAACNAGFDHAQAAKSFQDAMSGIFHQFGAYPNRPEMGRPSDVGGTTSESNKQNSRDITQNSGQGSETSSRKPRFNFMNPEKSETSSSSAGRSEDNPKCDDARITRSLAQMKAMGFNDDGGWLTKLLTDKDGDVGRVLDSILPSKM